MDSHELERAYFDLRSAMDGAPADLNKLFDELLRAAIRYAELRVRWGLAALDERTEIDETRTRAHNTFITCCNSLSRAMRRVELSTDWRKLIGDEQSPEGCKRVGDFACLLFFKLCLEAR